MSYLKTITLSLLIIGLIVSCRLNGNSNLAQSNKLNTFQQNISNVQIDNQTVAKNENLPKTKEESLFQEKPRRKSIKFPGDCTTLIPAGEENSQLQETCAAAIKEVFPSLPKTTGIGLSSETLNCNYQNLEDENNWNANQGIEFYPLLSNKYLVKIRCTTGAYNEINTYLLYDEASLPAKAQVLEFSSFEFEYPDDENSDTPKSVKKVTVQTVGGRFFNSQTKELIVFVKASGVGNAGHYARYSFPNAKPKLLEFRAKFKWEGVEYQTDEIIKNPPGTWKRYYP